MPANLITILIDQLHTSYLSLSDPLARFEKKGAFEYGTEVIPS